MVEPIEWIQLGMGLFGGLALFLFGMDLMTKSLRSAAGEGLKTILARLTRNRVYGALTGALVTAVLAGSMAGIPPLAGFLSKELILKKAMLTDLWVHAVAIGAIVLGSIGTVAYSSRFFFEVFTGRPRSRFSAIALPSMDLRVMSGLATGPAVGSQNQPRAAISPAMASGTRNLAGFMPAAACPPADPRPGSMRYCPPGAGATRQRVSGCRARSSAAARSSAG